MVPTEWWSLSENEGIRVAARVAQGLIVRRRLADDLECLSPSLLDVDEVALFDTESGTVRGLRIGDGTEATVDWLSWADWQPVAESLGWIAR
jgi:hypothetical protein